MTVIDYGNASLNRWALTGDLRVCKESELLMCHGREFQKVGEVVAKARSPKVQCLVLVMGVRMLESADRRWKVSEIRGGKVIESFVRKNHLVFTSTWFYCY